MEERVAIFIDGSNLYRTLKDNMGRQDLDYSKFAQRLVGKRTLLRLYYYGAIVDQFKDPERSKKQQQFFFNLQKTPYLELRRGRLNTYGDIEVEKGVDVLLAVDMLKLGWSHAYDTAILVSHDDDFSSAVLAVKEMGRHVECAGCTAQNMEKRMAQHLAEVSDKVIELDRNFLEGCWLK